MIQKTLSILSFAHHLSRVVDNSKTQIFDEFSLSFAARNDIIFFDVFDETEMIWKSEIIVRYYSFIQVWKLCSAMMAFFIFLSFCR